MNPANVLHDKTAVYWTIFPCEKLLQKVHFKFVSEKYFLKQKLR